LLVLGAHPQPGDFRFVVVVSVHSVARHLECLPRLPEIQVVGHDCEHRGSLHDDVDGGRGTLRSELIPWCACVPAAVGLVHLQRVSVFSEDFVVHACQIKR
jgi:hypothetical protein